MNNIIKYAFLFIFLVLLQAGVLSHLNLFGFLNPFLYIYLLITLPLSTPRIYMLWIGFALGLSIDMLLNTPGLHTIPTTFIAFIRNQVAQKSLVRGELEGIKVPTVFTMGFSAFVTYAGILVVLHHSILFFLDAFGFHHFFAVLLNTVYSSMLTMSLIILIQFLFVSRKRIEMY